MRDFFDLEHFIHGIKTVIACLLGLLLTRWVGLQADQWVVITIIVVMCAQLYVGSVLQKAYLRFLGTLFGCLFAASTLLIMGDTPAAIAIAISLSGFIFSYLATKYENFTYAGTLGAVTTAIIMLGQQPTLLLAFERFLEISLGILIATLVSQFVLPIHARTHLRYVQASTLRQLRDYYQETMLNKPPAQMDYQELDEAIIKSLLKQRQLAKESEPEELGSIFDKQQFARSLSCEREILRSMAFMHQAMLHFKKAAVLFLETPTGKQFSADTVAALTRLIQRIKSNKTSTTALTLPSIAELKKETEEKQFDEEQIYIAAFLFSAEILASGIVKLAKIYDIPIANPDKIPQNLAL